MSSNLFDQPETVPMSTALVEREVTPMALLQDAVKEGMTPDQLAVLVGLQRDMAKDAAERSYAEAMAACQAEMPVVVADGVNPDTNRKFPKFETIQQTAKPIYSKYGFALTFTDAECPDAGWKRTACDCRHKGGHVTHHFIGLPVDGKTATGNVITKMNPVQGCVSTNSYAQRVLTCNIFNITIAGKDADGRGGGSPIDEKQLVQLNELMEARAAELGGEFPLDGLLKWLGVEKLDEIPAKEFGKAVHGIKSAKGQSREHKW